MFGDEQLTVSRLHTLVTYLPPESMFIHLNKDTKSSVSSNPYDGATEQRATAPAVTSLSGVDPRLFYSGELTWH